MILRCYYIESVPPKYEKQTLYVTVQGLYDHTSDLLAWEDIQSLPELKTNLTVNAPLGIGLALPWCAVPCPHTSVPGATGFTLTSKSQQTVKCKKSVRTTSGVGNAARENCEGRCGSGGPQIVHLRRRV